MSVSRARVRSKSRNRLKKSKTTNPRLREVELIATVLATLPVVNRASENAEPFPYNGVASSETMQALVEKLVRRRCPENTWNKIHARLCKADETGNGYWSWTDAFRDASFQCGVEYAHRKFPDWWPLLRFIKPQTLDDLGEFIRRIAENSDGYEQRVAVPVTQDQMTRFASGGAR